ncbi:HEPN domain-containing protein [Chitinophaga filiformis]|uniref:HEPN domain-containing protein n=1 Tax=Chitinophaga filiformis TaxID=104663 RepID=A0ABY4HT54_CHIFI|nr:HEPN domain-containing protein [Chitinophaga filiformis]UPK66585.1 HEPN domain-containing protein [Chitinophaga filiformis]
MSNILSFKEKSNQNLLSARYLIKKKTYCSSVHCSFYSCLQTMFHVLFTKKKIIKTEFIAKSKHNGISSHIQAFKLIGNEIASSDFRDYKWFQKQYPELKHLREKADYSDEFIIQEEVYDAFNKANSIISLVNKI